MTITRTLALATLLGTSFPAWSQTIPQHTATQSKAAEPDPDPAMLRAMRSKVFEVKHRSPSFLIRSLGALGSGVRGVRMDVSEFAGLNTITVRDFPENLAAIEEAIKRLDVPAAIQKATDVELTIHVLFASKGPVSDGELPAELHDVVKQLKSTLTYRSYALAASFLQRVQVQDNAASYPSGLGYVPPGVLGSSEGKDAPRIKVEWRTQGLRLVGQGEGPYTLEVGTFRFDLEEETATKSGTLAKFNTPLSLREGERVVVGTSVVKDHGVVVVLTAHRIKR